MRERNLSIDAIKGLAIVLVMFGHVFVHNHMEDPYVYDFIKAVQMPLFIIISGYLCGQGRKIENLKSYGKIMEKRAVAYLVPMFAWLTIKHLDELFFAYKTIFIQLDYGLWFLGVLFVLTFMVYTAQLAAAKLSKKNKMLSELVFWAVYGVLCLILVVQTLTGNSFLSPNLTIIYVPFYLMGYVAAVYGKRFFCWDCDIDARLDLKKSYFVKAAVAIASIVFLYLLAAKNLNSMESRLDVLVQMAASMLGCITIIYGVFSLKDGKIKNIFAKIGNYTLELYVIHYHFANMLNFNNKQYDFYTPEGVMFVVLSFVAMCAVTFCCIWVMKKIKLVDFLFFGKKS